MSGSTAGCIGRGLVVMLLVMGATTSVLACSSGAAGRPDVGDRADGADADASAAPTAEASRVDPVSESSAATDQVEATDACWITDSKHQVVSSLGFKGIKGAGRVTPGRDLPRYVPLWGTEPEIQTDGAAWVFWFQGVVEIPLDVVERDPICVVIDGYPTWYSVGASYQDGDWVDAKPPPVGGPTKTLPAVQP